MNVLILFSSKTTSPTHRLHNCNTLFLGIFKQKRKRTKQKPQKQQQTNKQTNKQTNIFISTHKNVGPTTTSFQKSVSIMTNLFLSKLVLRYFFKCHKIVCCFIGIIMTINSMFDSPQFSVYRNLPIITKHFRIHTYFLS